MASAISRRVGRRSWLVTQPLAAVADHSTLRCWLDKRPRRRLRRAYGNVHSRLTHELTSGKRFLSDAGVWRVSRCSAWRWTIDLNVYRAPAPSRFFPCCALVSSIRLTCGRRARIKGGYEDGWTDGALEPPSSRCATSAAACSLRQPFRRNAREKAKSPSKLEQ